MITYLKQDITTITRGVICHGVNCQGAMNSGVARAIRDKWPEVYDAYKLVPTGHAVLGTAQRVGLTNDDSLFVVNCFTQLFYGKNGRFADAHAIETSLWKAYEWADYYDLPLYMPKIGAGLGGLSWEDDVLPVVEKADACWNRTDTFVCVLD